MEGNLEKMFRSTSNSPSNNNLRRSMDFIGILYFFFLACMCIVELIRNESMVTLPIGVPMFFDMAVLSLALIISVFFSMFADLKLLAKEIYHSRAIEDEIGTTFLLYMGLSIATLVLYARLYDIQSGHVLNEVGILFLFVSAYELILRVKPRIDNKKTWKVEERNISQWLKNLRESHGVAVPVFVLLYFAGSLRSWKMEGFWNFQSLERNEYIIVYLFLVCVIAASAIIVRKFVRIQIRRGVRIGMVIVLSMLLGAVVYFRVTDSDATIILFPMLIGYILMGVDRATYWYANYFAIENNHQISEDVSYK